MSNAWKVSTDLLEYLPSLPLDAYPAGVMRGLQPAVKWGQEGVSASHNWLERTVIAVLTDTITTLNVFHILYTRRPPNPLPDLLWSVYVTTEGPCMGYATIQDAACAVRVWRGSDVTAANQDTTPSQTASHVPVKGLV